jgi:hypothetical protein
VRKPLENEVRSVADGCILGDVASSELVEAGLFVQAGGVDAGEDSLRDECRDASRNGRRESA